VKIDYEAIAGGHYSHIASVIAGTAFYLPVSAIYQYQSEMGNRCISRDGKFINVDGDFFMDNAQWEYNLTDEELAMYNKEYARATR
jgi:hypothetical protein